MGALKYGNINLDTDRAQEESPAKQGNSR